MKLFVFCLFSVCLCSLATQLSKEKRKLKELLVQLDHFNKTLKLDYRNTSLPTPPENIKNCCSLSALECFRANLHVHFNIKQDHELIKSLKSSLTKKGLTFDGSTDATLTCENCASHPNANGDEFLKRLQSLIQKGINW